MTSQLRDAEFACFLPSGSENPIPLLRFHLVGDDAFDADTLLRRCAEVIVCFEPYTPDADEDPNEVELRENVVVFCYGPGARARREVEKPWLNVSTSFTRDQVAQFRTYVASVGYWWLMVRYNDAEQFISFTVDQHGSIITRHTLSQDNRIGTLVEGRSYH